MYFIKEIIICMCVHTHVYMHPQTHIYTHIHIYILVYKGIYADDKNVTCNLYIQEK